MKILKGTTEWLLIFYGDDPTLSEGFAVVNVLQREGVRLHKFTPHVATTSAPRLVWFSADVKGADTLSRPLL